MTHAAATRYGKAEQVTLDHAVSVKGDEAKTIREIKEQLEKMTENFQKVCQQEDPSEDRTAGFCRLALKSLELNRNLLPGIEQATYIKRLAAEVDRYVGAYLEGDQENADARPELAKEVVGDLHQFLISSGPLAHRVDLDQVKEKEVLTPQTLVKAVNLTKDLEKIVSKVRECMEDTDKKDNLGALEALIQEISEQLENLFANKTNLEKQLLPIIAALEGLAKRHEEEQFPVAHVGSIACFNGLTQKQVLEELERRETINKERLERHDTLVSAYLNILLAAEEALWEFERLTIFSNLVLPINAFYNQLEDLKGKIENMKERLREAVPEKKGKEKELQGMLGTEQTTHEKLCTSYKKMAEQVLQYRDEVRDSMKKLHEYIVGDCSSLMEAQQNTCIFNQDVKDSVSKQYKTTLEAVKKERQSLRDMLKEKWEGKPDEKQGIHELFELPSNQKSLAYQLKRLSYALKQYNGVIPRDATYKARMGGWDCDNPVQSPWDKQ